MNATVAKSLGSRTASNHSPEVRKAASTFDDLANSGLMRQAQIIPDLIPVSPATWWRGVKTGRFPKPRKLPGGGRASFWTVSDIRKLLATQAQSAA
jgi:predicted DNA-binding transcriptional regulator AlpA